MWWAEAGSHANQTAPREGLRSESLTDGIERSIQSCSIVARKPSSLLCERDLTIELTETVENKLRLLHLVGHQTETATPTRVSPRVAIGPATPRRSEIADSAMREVSELGWARVWERVIAV